MKINFTHIIALLVCFSLVEPARAQFRTDRPDFFRDGYDQMQQEIQRLQQQQQQTPQQQIEHPSQLLTITEGNLRWQKYIFRDGGFSVWLPEGLQSQETVVLETKQGKISFDVFATHPQSLRFVAAYSDVLDSDLLKDTQNLLDSVQDGIIAQTEYKLIDSKPTTLEQYPGRELSLENQGETIKFRLYLIGQRVYVLAATEKGTEITQQNIQEFFDSFRLL